MKKRQSKYRQLNLEPQRVAEALDLVARWDIYRDFVPVEHFLDDVYANAAAAQINAASDRERRHVYRSRRDIDEAMKQIRHIVDVSPDFWTDEKCEEICKILATL